MPPRKKSSVVVPATLDADDGSEESEEMSDPEDDIADAEFDTVRVEFDTVRDAARDRLAERTRTQYDLFIGLMLK